MEPKNAPKAKETHRVCTRKNQQKKAIITLPKTKSKSHWKYAETQKETILFQPSTFRGKLLVSGRVVIVLSLWVLGRNIMML